MANLLMSTFLSPVLCANIDTSHRYPSQCQNATPWFCGSCRLVKYCSKECQVANWPGHKKLCKSDLMQPIYTPAWVDQGREPLFDVEQLGPRQYLFGNTPALDVLNLKDNESLQDHRDYDLLFAASGDLRNIVKSVLGLPKKYTGQCTVVLNDLNCSVVVRNIVLLLVAMSLDPKDAVPVMIHVWYSAFIPASMLQLLQGKILPRIDEVCDKLEDNATTFIHAETFPFDRSELLVELSKTGWEQLRKALSLRGLTVERAHELRHSVTLGPERADHRDFIFYSRPPALRAALRKYWDDGLLLPFGSSRHAFDTPNPTLFQQQCWPMWDDANPLEGWAGGLYRSPTNNDVYGNLFFMLRNILSRFCQKVRESSVTFWALNVDAKDIMAHLQGLHGVILRFDRIEVSNIADVSYAGPQKTLAAVAPLLKPKTINPKATLLLLFQAVVVDDIRKHRNSNEGQYWNEDPVILELRNQFRVSRSDIWQTYTNRIRSEWSPEKYNEGRLSIMFYDFEAAFERFLVEEDVERIADANNLAIKEPSTIVDPWPYRITRNLTQEDFKAVCDSQMNRHERYLEFARLSDFGWGYCLRGG